MLFFLGVLTIIFLFGVLCGEFRTIGILLMIVLVPCLFVVAVFFFSSEAPSILVGVERTRSEVEAKGGGLYIIIAGGAGVALVVLGLGWAFGWMLRQGFGPAPRSRASRTVHTGVMLQDYDRVRDRHDD